MPAGVPVQQAGNTADAVAADLSLMGMGHSVLVFFFFLFEFWGLFTRTFHSQRVDAWWFFPRPC